MSLLQLSEQNYLTALAATWGVGQLFALGSQGLPSASILGRVAGGMEPITDVATCCFAAGFLAAHLKDPESDHHSALTCPKVLFTAVWTAYSLGKHLCGPNSPGWVDSLGTYGVPAVIAWSGIRSGKTSGSQWLLASAFLMRSGGIPLSLHQKALLSSSFGILASGSFLYTQLRNDTTQSTRPLDPYTG